MKSSPKETAAKLRELGELLNYNGYGLTVDDLYYPPEELYKALHPYAEPLDFLEHSKVLAKLRQGYHEDMQTALEYQPVRTSAAGRIYELPPAAWARRVSGVFSNRIARDKPALAHGLLTRNPDETYRVNVRAPLNNKLGADTLCRSFATGGGRAAAAGINSLDGDQLELFFAKFDEGFKTRIQDS